MEAPAAPPMLSSGAYIIGAAPRGSWTLELAAQSRVLTDPAVFHIIAAGPEGARMSMELIALPGAVDVGPAGHFPVDLDGFAVAPGGGPVCELFGGTEHVIECFAAPIRKIPGRLPAAEIAVLGRGANALLLQDGLLECPVDLFGAGQQAGEDRCRKEAGHFGLDIGGCAVGKILAGH